MCFFRLGEGNVEEAIAGEVADGIGAAVQAVQHRP
jgi:hypothetical protein